MAAREAVKLIADAMEDNLQTKLDALTVVEGEQAPSIVRFLNFYEDDSLDVADWPVVVVGLSPEATPEAHLESQGMCDVMVPLEIAYLTHESNTAEARARGSYAARGILHVLNDVLSGSENSVQLVALRDLAYTYTANEDGSDLSVVVAVNAHMRDTTP